MDQFTHPFRLCRLPRKVPSHPTEGTTPSRVDGTAIGSISKLIILPKDTSTRGLEEPGIKPLILRLADDPLYLLSHCGVSECRMTARTLGRHDPVEISAPRKKYTALMCTAVSKRKYANWNAPNECVCAATWCPPEASWLKRLKKVVNFDVWKV